MINKNYLLLVHKEPLQVLRLINRLKDGSSSFFIHVDKKSELSDFTSVINGDNIIYLQNRTNTIWGDFSKILAVIELIKLSLK